MIGGFNLSNIQSLCRNYTNLSATDIDKLIEIEATLKYYAELTDCYMFIDCMMDNLSHAIVVAEAFPKKEKRFI
ncbi:histidine kinase N-terminal domain-containing protein [Lysinibacillus sp. MHQ-1]|nr:histidine kinase N-terminal domain-containing protein [Lysinibacillus sp. MHQ-1]